MVQGEDGLEAAAGIEDERTGLLCEAPQEIPGARPVWQGLEHLLILPWHLWLPVLIFMLG
jgi:hypothetical protein